METQDFMNLLLGASCAVLGWFAKTLYEAIQELRRDLSLLHVEVARDYVPVVRFEESVAAIHAKLDRVLERLSAK